MLPRAVRGRVAYVSGTAFYYDSRGANHMRLSFCYPTPAEIHEGVRRLAGVVNAEKELVEMFGAGFIPPDADVTTGRVLPPQAPSDQGPAPDMP